MNPDHKHIAVLLFAHSASREARTKRFFSNVSSDTKFWRDSHKQINALATHAGLDFFHIDSTQQRGKRFGERLGNAVNDIFTLGYKRLIIVGNDCPDLDQTDFTKAINALKHSPLALGLNKRGGAYMISLDKSVFDFNEFVNLKWNSKRLIDSVQEYIKRYGQSITVIGLKSDLNTRSDLLTAIRLSKILKHKFKALLKISHNYEWLQRCLISSASRITSLRAPPFSFY